MVKTYRIINNNNQKQNVLVKAENINIAKDTGAFLLRSFNIRAIELKEAKK